MIKVDKGKVEVVGKSSEIYTDIMLVCNIMKEKSSEKTWDTFAHYFVEHLTDVRIYETAGETMICKDMVNLTIGLAYVLRQISKQYEADREMILKMAFELADDLLKYGDEAVIKRVDDLLKMGGYK